MASAPEMKLLEYKLNAQEIKVRTKAAKYSCGVDWHLSFLKPTAKQKSFQIQTGEITRLQTARE